MFSSQNRQSIVGEVKSRVVYLGGRWVLQVDLCQETLQGVEERVAKIRHIVYLEVKLLPQISFVGGYFGRFLEKSIKEIHGNNDIVRLIKVILEIIWCSSASVKH